MAADYIFPVQGFYFTVKFNDINTVIDNAFQEVSGISVKRQTEEIKAGGVNNRIYKVPSRVSYENLTLKRGHSKMETDLTQWIDEQLISNFKTFIKPRDITIQLMNPYDKQPLMSWFFERAYPVAWNISTFHAQKNEIVIETLEFAYTYMFRKIVAQSDNGDSGVGALFDDE